MGSVTYTIGRAKGRPELAGAWDGAVWGEASVAEVRCFHSRGSEHRPRTLVKVLYDDEALYVAFDVSDRYVCCRHAIYNEMVCEDSCVEFFVQPRAEQGYFNFEVNCGGTLLLSYVEDPTRTTDGFVKFTSVPKALGGQVRIFHTLPRLVPAEIADPVEWRVECAVPLALLEHYVGPLGALAGQRWRGNFYKCADASSHPHWGSWAPQGDTLNFHRPEIFGELRFEG